MSSQEFIHRIIGTNHTPVFFDRRHHVDESTLIKPAGEYNGNCRGNQLKVLQAATRATNIETSASYNKQSN